MIRLSYNANGLRGLPLTEAIDVTASLGFDGIELSLHPNHLDPATTNEPACLAISRQLADRNLAVSCLATGADTLLGTERFEPSLTHPDSAGRSRRVDLIRKAIDIAVAVGAPVVNFASGPFRQDVSRQVAGSHLREGLRRCLDHAAGQVVLAIEPEPGFLISTNRQALTLVTDMNVDGLAINQDIGHEHIATDDYLGAIAEALPFTAHIHVEDIRDRIHDHLIPGEGRIDFGAFVRVLKSGGYHGFLSVELYNHGRDYMRAMTTSLSFFRPLLAEEPEVVVA